MFSIRGSRVILLLAAALLPLLIWTAVSIETNTDDVKIWLPRNTPERLAWDRFTKLFGPDNQILISWPGCTLDDPRLEEFANVLQTADAETGLYSRVTTGNSVLDQLAGRKYSHSRQRIISGLTGVLFSGIDNTTAVVVAMSSKGIGRSRESVEGIEAAADQVTGLGRARLRIGSDTNTVVEVDRATGRSLLLAIPGVLLAVALAFFALRDWQHAGPALGVAGYSGLAAIALVGLCGLKLNGLLVITPILTIVLTLSGAVHLCHYHRRSQNESDPLAAMLKFGWRPCLFALGTTAIGVGMLATSQIPAVRIFGLVSCLSLLVGVALLLFLLPASIRLLPRIANSGQQQTQPDAPQSEISRNGVGRGSERLEKTGLTPQWLTATSGPKLLILLAILVTPFIWGLSRLQTTLQPEAMFPLDHPVNAELNWLGKRFSSINSIDVVAEFESNDDDLIGQVRRVASIQSKLADLPGVEATFSIANLVRLPRKRRSASQLVEYSLVNDGLRSDRDLLVQQRLLAEVGENRYWRIQLGVDASCVDSRRLSFLIGQTVVGEGGANKEQPDVWMSGIWPLVSTGREIVVSDLGRSFTLAFVVIAPLMMLVLRGFFAGLLAMIPNVMPALIFFGTAGLTGIPIDIGTVLTASVGLGIAVDDTLHFLNCFDRNRSRFDCRFQSVKATVHQCWRPMVHTSVICIAGLSLFAFSDFLPARNFAIAISALSVLALLADLILLPILIRSSAGSYFER